jgi:hypothetical protein
MFSRCLTHRGIAAIAAFVLFVSGAVPARADVPTLDDQNSAMALMLFGRQTCAQRAAAVAQTTQYVAPATPQPSDAQPLATGADAQPPPEQTKVVIAQATAQPSSSPQTTEAPGVPGPATPGPVNTPGLPTQPAGIGNGTYQLYATPKPPPGVSPPPVPTPTPIVSPAVTRRRRSLPPDARGRRRRPSRPAWRPSRRTT